jgi:hypothetical protein
MSASNGRLSASELAQIIGGELANDAAAAWKAPQGPEANGCRPEGPQGSYRDIAGQEQTWATYLAGGPLAAQIGTSIHGLGKALDLLEEWMRSWIDDHGARFGWRKTEAFSEWWHVNFVGGVSFKLFESLHKGSRGRRVRFYTKRLAFIRHGHGPAYLPRWYWRFKAPVVDAVYEFQTDQGLQADGVIGEHTAHRISAVFHKQYVARKGKRKRRLRDVIRRRP